MPKNLTITKKKDVTNNKNENGKYLTF